MGWQPTCQTPRSTEFPHAEQPGGQHDVPAEYRNHYRPDGLITREVGRLAPELGFERIDMYDDGNPRCQFRCQFEDVRERNSLIHRRSEIRKQKALGFRPAAAAADPCNIHTQ